MSTITDSPGHAYLLSASYVAMTVWAYEELAQGVNWFRRLLETAYVIVLIVRVAHGLRASFKEGRDGFGGRSKDLHGLGDL